MDTEQKIKNHIATLRLLVQQLRYEIVELEGEDVDENLFSLPDAFDKSIYLLEKDLFFILQNKLNDTNQEDTTQNTDKKAFKRIPVDSSMVSAVAYDTKEEILFLEFVNSGKIYAYYEVAEAVFDELLEADSIGRYVRDNIIDCYSSIQIKRKGFKW